MATFSEKTADVRGARAGRRRGFTLIELLIVIGIIGILISLLFPAVRGVIESARRQQTRQACKAIETAVKAYYNDYGRYPLQGTLSAALNSQPHTYTSYDQLIRILRGLDTTHNPRAIAYLDVPQGALNPAGLFVDPWDQTFGVTADWGNAAGLALFPFPPSLINYPGVTVAVWSKGPDASEDRARAIRAGVNTDNIYSWTD